MEANDAFGGGVEIGDGDPFEGTDFGDFGETSEGEPTGELKTVDKEGNEVPPSGEPDKSGGHPTMTEEQAAKNAAEYEERTMGAPAPNAASAESSEGEAAEPESPVETPQQAAPAPAQSAEAAVEVAPTTPPAGEADPTPADSPDSAASTEAGSAGASQPEAESVPEAEAAPDDAPPPEERQTNGRTTHRRYFLLRVEGPGKFAQVSWHEDADGNMVAKGTAGSKRQTVALARGTDDALKLGYRACGSPEDGVQLVAVAALHFQPRKVRPKPPEPSRQRLQIS